MLIAQIKKIIASDQAIVPLLLCTAFSLFLFNVSFRTIFNEGSINSSYNLLFIIFGLLGIAVFMLNQLVDIGIVFLTSAFFGVTIFTVIYGGQDSFQISIIPSMVMPFLLLGFRVPETAFNTFLRIFIKVFSLVVIIVVISGIGDYVSNKSLQVYFAQHIFSNELARLVNNELSYGIYRLFSVFGHPLSNTWYVLAFYALNILYNRYYRQLINEYLLILVTLIGLLLCGSRTGLIIGLFMILFLNNIKHKLPFYVLLSTFCTGIVITPFFQENMMRRFFIGSNTGNFSGGRNEALYRVFKGFVEQPDFFIGGGLSSSRQITLNMVGVINSFEYPSVMFAYDFGILGTILIYLLILIIPALIFLTNRTYFLLITFLMLSAYMNGFNALASYTDHMGQLCFLTMVMLNMSYIVRRNRDEALAKECESDIINNVLGG